MKRHTKIDLSNGGAGFGPAAWDRDTQKGSMHPPIPGHIEFVEKTMEALKKHHVAKRRHPENDEDSTLIQREIKAEDMAHKSHTRKHHLLRRNPDKKHGNLPSTQCDRNSEHRKE